MENTLDFLDYKNYRVPYIDEFKPGLIYYYEQVAIKTPLPIASLGKCKVQIGMTIYEARILESFKDSTVRIKILEEIQNKTYFNLTLQYSNLSLDKFPVKYLYDYEGFETPFSYPHQIERVIKKGIWGTGFGYQSLNFLNTAIKEKRVWVKGKILSKNNSNKNNKYAWISVTRPEKELTESICLKSLGENYTNFPEYTLWYDYYCQKTNYYYLTSKIFPSRIHMNIFINNNKSIYRLLYCIVTDQNKFIKKINFVNTNLEESNPMKRIENMDTQLIQELSNYTNKEKARRKLKYLKPELTWKQVKEIINNVWIDKAKKEIDVKMMNAHHLALVKIPIQHFTVSYAKNGKLTQDGIPSLEITTSVSGISIDAALRRLKDAQGNKVNKQHITRISKITHSVRSDPKIKVIYQRRLKTKQQLLLKKNKKRFNKKSKQVKFNHIPNENRLICIKHIETQEVLRLPRLEALTYDDTTWSITNKANYKKYRLQKEYIAPPLEKSMKQEEKFQKKLKKDFKKVVLKRAEEHRKKVKTGRTNTRYVKSRLKRRRIRNNLKRIKSNAE